MTNQFQTFELEDFCSVYDGASVVNFIFSLLITLGIFVSYLPQYFRIYKKKTSEGLSVNFLFLGSCSSIFTFTNIIMISSRARYCCRVGALTLFNCLNSQLNLLQIGLQCTCAIMILVLVLSFTRGSVLQDKEEYARIVNVGRLVMFHGVVSLIQIVVAFATNRQVLLALAQFNGLMSTLLTIIKYVPQIITTYKLKHPGTLSIGMMCIQTPGGFVFTATLFFTKGLHWSSWVSYFVAAMLQGSLLLLCIYYEHFSGYKDLERQQLERIIEENTRDAHDRAQAETSPLAN
ncbi:CIC11C00000000518 [Sungouiella intermedia]|uniref:CIC11C00000000518 n=1 Tax=Sungouiella intermedia TaxID=45354 RepID=A0A1L0BRP3_9ASCO|nr:CIC11C00000004786 [[Candida] intermedia]SGZ54025.1 CIC11C00000000518 [[Candida] intermedia]